MIDEAKPVSQSSKAQLIPQKKTIFRAEALDAQRNRGTGSIVLIRPLRFAFLTALAVMCAIAITVFLIFGEYTKRAHVPGLLVPDAGLLSVNSPTPGTVIEQHVTEGQKLHAGDVLFVIETEKRISQSDGTTFSAGTALDVSLRERERSLSNEALQQSLLVEQQRFQYQGLLRSLQGEADHINGQMATQSERVASAQAQLQRWKGLVDQKFASEVSLQERKDAVLEQTSRLQALQQSRIQINRQSEQAKREMEQLDTKVAGQQEQLRRASSELEQSQINLETQRKSVITSPVDGIATGIMANVGQSVGHQNLVNVLPAGSQLEVHLYATSRSAGFVQAGQEVRMRYNAYPFQKFGQYTGRVISVSRSPISAKELPDILGNLSQQFGGEGLYRITVKPNSQNVMAYGKETPLSAGMQLEADVIQEKRTIFEWMFESLLTLKARA